MSDNYFQPVSGFDLPRFAGVATFMRLPNVALDDPKISEVKIGLIGVPWDGGTTNRSGPRHGPRLLRNMSTMMRAPKWRYRCASVRTGQLCRSWGHAA